MQRSHVLQLACAVAAITLAGAPPLRAGEAARRPARPSEVEIAAIREYLDGRRQMRARCRSAFEAEATLTLHMSVEERLAHAADVTAEVRREAESATRDALLSADVVASSRVAMFPRWSHLIRLVAARPWLRSYVPLSRDEEGLFDGTSDIVWPTLDDRPALCKALGSPDGDIVALAIEALATLHQPQDVSLIALRDAEHRMVVPALEPSERLNGTRGMLERPPPEVDPLLPRISWRDSSREDYIRRALKLMTGATLDRSTFGRCARSSDKPGQPLWYWQQAMERDVRDMERRLNEEERAELERLFDEILRNPDGPPPIGASFRAERDARLLAAEAELRAEFERRLADMPAEVDAKIRLLTEHPNAGNETRRFFDDTAPLRLSRGRVLQLLRGEGLWEDADWVTPDRPSVEAAHARIVTRIAAAVDRLLGPENVPDLKEALAAETRSRSALILGISRLLPVVAPEGSAEENTRDGWLRHAVVSERRELDRAEAAHELVRVSLEANTSFLLERFKAEAAGGSFAPPCLSILRGLGETPLTEAKLDFLLRIAGDRELQRTFFEQGQVGAWGGHRAQAIRSINAHAGRAVLSENDAQLWQGRQFTSRWNAALAQARKLAAARRAAEGAR